MAEKYVDDGKIMTRVTDILLEPKRMLPPIKGYENEPLVSLEESVKPLVSFVPDVEQMVWTVKQNCQQSEDHLSLDESGSIMLYTLEWEPAESSFYYVLNSTLRSEHRQKLRPWFLYLRLVIYALAKLPSLPPRTIYRGVKMDLSKEFTKDKTFIWWSFSSCTSTIEVIKHFLGDKGPRTILNVETHSAKDISRHSFYTTENEILLYPARQLKVISSIDLGSQLHIVQLQEVQPPFSLIHIPQTAQVISPLTFISSTNSTYVNPELKQLIEQYQPNSKITLTGQRLTDQNMYIVVQEALVSKQCEELWIAYNQINSEGVRILAEGLSKSTTLKMLAIGQDHLHNEGIQYLASALSRTNNTLESLALERTGLTDNGIEYLSEMLKTNRHLKVLILPTNLISDQGVKILADTLIRHNRTLKVVDLQNNKLK
ncbi:unnamed protein product [Adineta ricciae]|uniref:NAD(P)(+)--arginine ADP-ribosyltransferase n=1 Tax=Adineta ricciae TaxID=249248 RepID=A0A814RNF1_ADIRI|nr:unnamed protein product [Adineta ricciae]